MNLSTLVGFMGAFLIFILAVRDTFASAASVVDLRSALLVIGGTVSVSLICFPLRRIMGLLRVFVRRLLGKNNHDYKGLIIEICQLAKAARTSRRALVEATENLTNPFLKDSARVLQSIDAEVSSEELRELLETRAETHYSEYMNEAKIFKTLSKFPPAFGLMGTTLGMMALMQSLGEQGAGDIIGKSMALALVATLYGLLVSNFVLLPIAENLSEQTRDDYLARQIVVEGVMLIRAQRPVKYIEEKLKSYLVPSKRGDDDRSSSPDDTKKAA